MIRERPDRDGLQVQVCAGATPHRCKRRVSHQVPGKGRAAMKRAKQVEAELRGGRLPGEGRGPARQVRLY
jgi:hypothetical protein